TRWFFAEPFSRQASQGAVDFQSKDLIVELASNRQTVGWKSGLNKCFRKPYNPPPCRAAEFTHHLTLKIVGSAEQWRQNRPGCDYERKVASVLERHWRG